MIRSPKAILALLTGLNLLNYLDRYVVSAVLPRVQAKLDMSNFEGGLLATLFLIGYFATSPFFGHVGSRGKRTGLIALGVAIWSLATVGSGLARSTLSLLAARALVGVGEASYATLAPTLIDDLAPQDRKAKWLSVFYVAAPVGSALGYLVGGFVERAANTWPWPLFQDGNGWRGAFFVAGGPGLLLALSCLLIHEPARTEGPNKLPLAESIRTLGRLAQYRTGVLGYCAYTAAVGGFSYWAPKFLFERYRMELAHANFVFGVITVVAGALGTAIGGVWGDRAVRAIPGGGGDEAQERATVAVYLRICAVGSAIGAPLAVGCFLSPSPQVFFVLVFFCEVALFLSTSPINAAILRSVPVTLRASAMALSIFAIHILGDLWSPPAVGLLADHMPIWLAMMSLPAAIFVSAIIWWPRAGARQAVAIDP
jgi:MFS family permease